VGGAGWVGGVRTQPKTEPTGGPDPSRASGPVFTTPAFRMQSNTFLGRPSEHHTPGNGPVLMVSIAFAVPRHQQGLDTLETHITHCTGFFFCRESRSDYRSLRVAEADCVRLQKHSASSFRSKGSGHSSPYEHNSSEPCPATAVRVTPTSAGRLVLDREMSDGMLCTARGQGG